MGLTDIFKPKWEHSDWKVRLEAVSALGEKDKLLMLAVMDRNEEVGLAAVDRLFELCKADGDFEMISHIAGQDQPLYPKRGTRARELIRQHNLAAVEARADDRELEAVARQHDDQEVRIAAVERIGSQEALARIAVNAGDSHVQQAAIRRIDSPRLLAEIVRGARHLSPEACMLALKSCDRDLLHEVVLDGQRDAWLRKPLIEQVADQATLEALAMQGDRDLAGPTLERIRDDQRLERVARDCPFHETRLQAIRLIADPEILVGLALEPSTEAKERTGRAEAAARRLGVLKEGQALARIAHEAGNGETKAAAIRYLDDPALLAELAESLPEQRLAILAVERIRESRVLRRLAEAAHRSEVARAAAAQLGQPDIIEAESRTGATREIRKAAITQLWNLDLLEELAGTESDPELRQAARARFEEVKPRHEEIRRLREQIERLKRSKDYRWQIEWATREDNEGFPGFLESNPDAVYNQVEELERQLAAITGPCRHG